MNFYRTTQLKQGESCVRRQTKATSVGSIAGTGCFALALVAAAFIALALAPVSQAKIVVGGFGTNGTLGGQFTVASENRMPKGVAVNNSGNGAAKGTVYVVDNSGNRIERFSPTGSFERTWGQNVLGRDEKQTVTLSGVSGGSFTLSYNGNSTAAINVTVNGSGTITAPSATQIRDALLAAPVGIGSGNVVVSGSAGSYTVRFIGTLDGTDVSQLTGSAANLSGSAPSVAIATAENGSGGNSAGFEICTVAASCQDGMPVPGTTTAATTANGGDMNDPQGVAVNQANGHVYVTDQGNRRVQEFDADGNFVRAWGWDVDSAAGTGFEICTVAANCKTAAAAGTNVGQFGSALGYPITDASNNVWVPDPVNARIQVFNSSGAFLRIVGGDVITNGAQGTGTLAASSKTISSVTTTSKFFEVGQTITSPDHPGEILPGTTIASCTPANCAQATSITLSQNTAASVTAGPQTLSVAAGAGNVPSNETQTVSASKPASVLVGAFNPTFNGAGSNSTTASTAATATGDFTSGSAVVTNVNFTGGTLFVGEIVTKNGTALPTETTITAIDTVAKTITLSKAFTGASESAKTITGFAILVTDSASAVQTKLEAVPTIGAGNVSVSGPAGGPWAVEFVGRFAGADVPLMTAPVAARSPGSVSVTFSSANPGALESCAVAAECRTSAAASGTALGQFGVGLIGPTAAGFGDLAFDSSGNLYVIDTFNARVQKLNPTFTTATQFGAASFPLHTSLVPERMAATQSGARLAFVVNTGTTPFNGERQILELDPNDGSEKDKSLVGAGLTPNVVFEERGTIHGLANNDTNGNLYATVGSTASPRRVLALNATANEAPFVAMNDVTTKASTTATFSGSVDPKGGLVSCAFEYSTDKVTWSGKVNVPDCDSLASSGGSQPVSVNATGLAPATHYFVRLAVSRPLVANSTETSGFKAFDTDGVPPVVSNVGAVDVQDTSARLVGTIDPRNSATGYAFEYGTTPALGSTTPQVDIGGGTTPVVVSSSVTGLSPDTTYYFRLSATNLTASTTSSSKTLKTRSEPIPPPPDRAYEQVTPDAVNNVDAGIFEGAMMTAARDGNTVGVCNFYPPEGEGSGGCGSIANSRRTATGWQSKSFLPPTCARDPLTGAGGINGAAGGISLWSKNLDLAVFVRSEFAACPFSPLTLNPDAQTNVVNAYRGDFVSGSYDLLAPNPSQQTIELSEHKNLGASDDFGVIFYQSLTQQTVVGQAAPAGSFSKLYEWDHGILRLASIKPQAQGGTPFTESVDIAYAGLGGVSETGSRVFFQSPPAPSTSTQLYMREGGTTTYDIGQSECTGGVSCGSTSWKAFAGASEDASIALFESPQKLSDEDNDPSTTVRDLYLYRHSANPASDRNLYVLTRDNEPADGTSAQLRGELGRSEDGNTVFFAAAGQIVPGAPTADGFKVYRWRWNGGSPQVDFLANLDGTLPPGDGCAGTYKAGKPWTDEQNWTCEQRNLGERFLPEQERVSRVRADGGQLTIDTIKALDPAADYDSTRDVYTWDEAHGWRCISCQAPGVPSAGDSQAQGPNGVNYREMFTQNELPALITSSDGKKIYFTSRDQLVPGDTNGTVRDVYEWNDGTLSLISSGTSNADNLLVGTTPSGNDVFFVTAQRLVGWDLDDARDIYDARVGGGFPEPRPTDEICEGEACRSAGTGAPENTGAGTAVFQGADNSGGKAPKPCPKGTRKVTIKGKQVCKKRGHQSKAKKHRRAASNDRRASR
jgi:hypothetical protein